MLEVLTTDEFAEWFRALDDRTAEEVATALDIVERLGPARAAPGSRESLLWYEHATVSRFHEEDWLAWELEDWGAYQEYARRVVEQLQSPRFVARLRRLSSPAATTVLRAVEAIKRRSGVRVWWALSNAAGGSTPTIRKKYACDEVRRLYLAALAAADLEVIEVPAHSPALRELSLRSLRPGVRLLYGIDTPREIALFVLGEWLDRSFYGDSVRRAEYLWKQFLEGTLRAIEPAQLR